MPSPVGHALGGCLVALVAEVLLPTASDVRSPRRVLRLPLVTAAAVAAVLPDVDFLWARHGMETHSLGAAVLAGGLVRWWRGPGGRWPAVVAAGWASHVLFDWLGSDDTAPLGVMALWPLSSESFFAYAYVFEAISRRYWLDGFLAHNTWAVTTEVLMLGPLVALATLAASWRRRQRPV